MKKRSIIILVFMLAMSTVFARKPNADKILAEGMLLYRLEKASWHATDDLVANYPKLLAKVGGYLSYQANDGHVNTVFYSKNNPDSIVIRYQFTDLLNKTFTMLPLIGKKDRDTERELITVREDALKMMRENADVFFTFYENTSVNCILVPVGRKKKVYILTAPKSYGNVLLGGDYMLTYNSKNLLVDRRKIHNSLITLSAGDNVSNEKTAMTMHSHVLSEAIDPTDICTLLLYKDFVDWKKHVVVGKKYVSVFDMDKETLAILTTEAWKKIYMHPEETTGK